MRDALGTHVYYGIGIPPLLHLLLDHLSAGDYSLYPFGKALYVGKCDTLRMV